MANQWNRFIAWSDFSGKRKQGWIWGETIEEATKNAAKYLNCPEESIYIFPDPNTQEDQDLLEVIKDIRDRLSGEE